MSLSEISPCPSSDRTVEKPRDAPKAHLKLSKTSVKIIQDAISRKLFKILTTRMGKHNEITVSLIEDACLYSLSCLRLGLHIEFQS